jgi:hypothetical protein
LVPQAAAQVIIAGTITGTFSGANAGACPSIATSDYANQCGVGPCENFTPMGPPKVTGTFGSGTITSMCLTVDLGNNVNEPSDLNTKNTCTPIYGYLVASTVHKQVTTKTTVNFAGVVCHHQPASSSHMIEAGFGIEGQDTDPAATGWGTLTGTVNKGTAAFSLKINGSLTP